MSLLKVMSIPLIATLALIRPNKQKPVEESKMQAPVFFITQDLTDEERAIALEKAVAEWRKARVLEEESASGFCRRTHD